MPNPFTVVLHPADTTGCSFYRMTAPYLTLQSVLQSNELNITVARRFIIDPDFYNNVNMVMSQRQVSDPQESYFNSFLIPLAKTRGMWNIYNIDDVIHGDDIPKYNSAWDMYQDKNTMDNIKKMTTSSDFVLVTTDELAQYFTDKFEVSSDDTIVIPNYLPHWWMSGRYDLSKTMTNLQKHRKKPRVGIISSASHFDVKNVNGGVDDISHIVDYIRSTVNKYQWVFFGTIPPALVDLVNSKKIEFRGGCDIMTYPHALHELDLNCIVAPLEDNTFNRCKSNIKLLEGWAMGIPVIAQDIPTYSKYTDMVFTTDKDLNSQLGRLFGDTQKYKKIVKDNYHRVDVTDKNSPNGWWLEKNLDKWIQVFKLRSKMIEIDLESFIDNSEKPKLEVIK